MCFTGPGAIPDARQTPVAGNKLIDIGIIEDPPLSTQPQSQAQERTTMTTAHATSPVDAQLREILARRIMILDGAMGTIIQQYKLDEQAYRGARFAGFSAPAGSGESGKTRELF